MISIVQIMNGSTMWVILLVPVDWWFRSCGHKTFEGLYGNPGDFIGIWSEYGYDLPHGKYILEYIGTLVVEILSMDWIFWYTI